MTGEMISTKPRILIKVTFPKQFALEVWVSIFLESQQIHWGSRGANMKPRVYPQYHSGSLNYIIVAIHNLKHRNEVLIGFSKIFDYI